MELFFDTQEQYEAYLDGGMLPCGTFIYVRETDKAYFATNNFTGEYAVYEAYRINKNAENE